MKSLRYILTIICIIMSFALIAEGKTNSANKGKILIICSYNPETQTASRTISDFIAEYQRLDNDEVPIIENMNCMTFSEMHTWRNVLKNILNKYNTAETTPSLIILLGQEAWASYLSMEETEILKNVPVMASQANRYLVKLPDSIPDPLIWEPQPIDALTMTKKYNLVGGIIHEYDVKRNIDLMKSFFPKIENIALITDNSYGGVAVSARAKELFHLYPLLNFIHIDGRREDLYSTSEKLDNLPENTGILLGTWRVDKTGSYYVKSSLSLIQKTAQSNPTFTITGLGIDNWAIGGFTPHYISQGTLMAQKAYEFLSSNNEVHNSNNPLKYFTILPNEFKFNASQLDNHNLNLTAFNNEYSIVDEKETLWDLYKKEIIIISASIILLVVLVFILLNLYLRTKRYQTRLESYQKELRVAKNKAEESNRMKSSFLANMSHEIRTPLNAICGFTEVLTSDEAVKLDKSERTYMTQIIQNNASLLLSLINGILDMSRIESGKMKYENVEFDWVTICKESIETVKASTHSDISFIFTSKHEELKMTADKNLMTQVLINLLNNASKFTKEGSITLELSGNKKFITVSVTDTGIGIPLEKQKNIFEQFVKLNERSQGTGLGLSLCKNIIEHYNGFIWIDNDYKEGARIVFSIPIDSNTTEG